MSLTAERVILNLHEIGVVKFGSFKLKSGIVSPIYIDFRLLISYPDFLNTIAVYVLDAANSSAIHDVICGVPYKALPIAAALSLEYGAPMLMHRNEVKALGTARSIEGVYEPGNICLVIEDFLARGASVLETAAQLRAEGLVVNDAAVVIDCQQGGRENLAENGIRLHAFTTLSEMVRVLVSHNKLTEKTAADVAQFIEANPRIVAPPALADGPRVTVSYGERAALAKMSLTEKVILKLHEIGAVKFGSFKQKSGIVSPFYIDFSLLMSYPDFLNSISVCLLDVAVLDAADESAVHDVICGVPYNALPIATALSFEYDTPMLMLHKEVKAHGTPQSIEGLYKPGIVCLVIEDFVTSGASVLETAAQLRAEGLVVTAAVAVIDCQQGGRENLAENGIRLHAFTTLSEMVRVLVSHKKLAEETAADVARFQASIAKN